MAYQLQEINRRIKTDVTEFLEECDQAYAQRVSLAADQHPEQSGARAPWCCSPGPRARARPPPP